MSSAAMSPATHTLLVKKLPQDLSPEIQALIKVVQGFDLATSWEEMQRAVKLLDDEAVLDDAGIVIPGKQRIRVLSLLFSHLLTKRLEPTFVSMSMVGRNEAQLEIVTNIFVLPKRRWWLLPTLMLPKEIPLKGEVCVTVDGSNDRIVCIKGRLHNIPSLIPYSLRYALGWTLGTMALLLEPLVLEVTRYFGMGPPVPEPLPNGSHSPVRNAISSPPAAAATPTTPAQAPASSHLGNGNAVPMMSGASSKMHNTQLPAPPLAPPQVY